MAITLDGTTGITTPGLTNTGTETIVSLTTTGNTILGDSSADTLNVGNGGLVKDASGNVGIGTASPTGKLSVAGNLTLEPGGSGPVASSRPQIWRGADGFLGIQSGGDTSGVIALYTGPSGTPAERMRIDSSGKILIGATSSNSGTRLSTVSSTSGVDTNTSIILSTSGTRYHWAFKDGTSETERGTITSNGSATAYNTTSDYRLKENILPMTGALATVQALKPVTYTWKESGDNSQGFIAHELQAVVPDCVTGEKDAVETYTDEEGNEQTRPKYQSVDTSFLVATLTAAIQELKAIVDAQAVRIAALES